MGKYTTGILGGFQGKIGPVVGSKWKDITYMRHKGRRTKKAPSVAQLAHQQKFGMVSKFIGSMTTLLMVSFKGTPRMAGSNMALSYNFKNAVKGNYPSYQLDFSKALVSKGDLPNVQAPGVAAMGNGRLQFNWEDNSGTALAAPDDITVMVIFCPGMKKAIFTKAGPARNAATATIHVANFTGKLVHTWIAVTSADEQDFATSIYTGSLLVV